MPDSPRPVPPRRQNSDSVLLYFDGSMIIFRGPLHEGAAVRDRIGIEGSDPFGPFVMVEIYMPEGDEFLPPNWAGEEQTGYVLSPEGVCVSRIIDSSQAVSESVPLGAVDSLPADAGRGRHWRVPPKLVGFSIFLPRNTVLSFERWSTGIPRIRGHAFSVKWEDDQILHVFTPKPTSESASAPSAGIPAPTAEVT